MKKEFIQEMYEQEVLYWWHKGRRLVIEGLLQNVLGSRTSLSILDVGCGSGIHLELFRQFGDVFGVDISEEAVAYCQEKGFQNVYQGKAEQLPFADNSFDMLSAIELLEHLQNDEEVLREFSRVLRKNGFLFITVPAYQFLWTEHDEALNHMRRYTLPVLKKKLTNAGFQVQKGTYMVTFTSPLFVYRIFKKILRRKDTRPQTLYVSVPFLVNKILIFSFYIEKAIVRWVPLPFGTSVVCIARKAQN
jgi:ubiquinone/menaquinone biosynthesis C-methylase UbiE